MAQLTEREKVAHLLRRVCFGTTPAQVEEYAALGLNGALERVLSYEAVPEGFDTPVWDFEVETGQGGIALRAPAVAAWWAWRMLKSERPLEQKLTLFWHDHFGCSAEVVKPGPLIYLHLETLREKASGSFEELLLAVARDPTMLTFLNTRENVKAHPNENFARELLELFTLGIGHYSEQDIQEAARAFTGWDFKRPEDYEYLFYDHPQPQFIFREGRHDGGVKTVLGQSGRFRGEDIVRLTAQHPQTARHISAKLWEWFAGSPPDEGLNTRLATAFTQSGLGVKALCRAIFSAEEFYSQDVVRAQYKNPADFVIGSLRAMGVAALVDEQVAKQGGSSGADGSVRQADAGTAARATAEGGERYSVARPIAGVARLLALSMGNMGLRLCFPPNVAGWDWGAAWVNSATMLERIKLADLFDPEGYKAARPNAPGGGQQKGRTFPARLLLQDTDCHNPMQVAEQCARVLDAGLGVGKLVVIAEAVAKKLGTELGREQLQAAVHETLRLIFASPEYQFA